MTLKTFLKKDVDWGRHRLLLVVVLFVGVPAIAGTGTLFFEHTVPEHSPIAIVPGEDNVTQDDLDVVRGGLSFVSEPTIVDSPSRAFDKLDREEVYAVVEVPAGISDQSATLTVDVSISGSVTIYRMPSRVLVMLISETLDDLLPSTVHAEHHVLGDKKSLSEYLLPTFTMLVVMLVAFIYLPYNLAAESAVFDRLRLKTSLERLVVAKFLFFGALLVPAVLTISGVGILLGYTIEAVSIPALGMYLLAFLTLGSLSSAIMFLTGFTNAGRILNVVAFFLLVPLSNLAYPAGFFSPLSKTIARLNPLHYTMIVARSHTLKDVTFGTFTDWIIGTALIAVLAALVLALSIRYYKRVQ